MILYNHHMSEPKNDLLASVREFVEDSKKPDSLVSKIKEIHPTVAKELDSQLSTIPDAIKDMMNMKMSYAEMRAKYG